MSLITRGYGSNTLITQGYGGIGGTISEIIKREVIRMKSSVQRVMNFLSRL